MKKMIPLLLLFCLLLSGCGTEQPQSEARLPYLTGEERAELEQGMINSLRLEVIDNTSSYTYYQRTELENVSDYQLSDILVRYTLSGEEAYFLDGLPPHTRFRNSGNNYLGTGEELRKKAEKMEYRYDISYTVGEFNYLISDCQILPETEEERSLTIEMGTDRGSVTFQIPGLEELEIDGTVDGIQTAVFHSITVGNNADYDHRINDKTGCFGGLRLKITGQEPEKDHLIICRLIDDEGIIRETSNLTNYSFTNGAADLGLYCPLEPGHYVLEFEEIERW